MRPDPPNSSAEMVEQVRRRISGIDGMTVDHKPEEMTISGALFTRLDNTGAGLFRAMPVAESRCHFLSFNLTTVDRDGRASLAQSLMIFSLGERTDRARSMPSCLKYSATPEHNRPRRAKVYPGSGAHHHRGRRTG